MLRPDDVEKIKDAENFSVAYENLDQNNKSIISTVVACMLARQQMEEEQKAVG